MSTRSPADTDQRQRTVRFWLRVRLATRWLFALGVFFAVWVVAFGGGNEELPVLPETEEQFSLDLRVQGQADHGLIYAVEQRARPAYRIFEFDPKTGNVRTIFTVPENAIIYGIALNNERTQLAVAYSPDFQDEGSGLWTLDLETDEFTEIVGVETDIYLTEPEWTGDGRTVLATRVDRRADEEALSIASVSLSHGAVDVLLVDAITPASQDGGLYYLTVDENKARRSIDHLDSDGQTTTISIGDGQFDLDHLITADANGEVHVAVLETTDEPAITAGTTADAHGNHTVPSTWWQVDTDPGPAAIAPILVYDADLSPDGVIVYATLEGLSIAKDERIDLIKSRAIRFVAA